MKDHELLDDDEYEWKPKKGLALTSESDGPMGRLLRAVNESDNAPIRSDWSNFILENFYSNPNHSSVINDSGRILYLFILFKSLCSISLLTWFLVKSK